MSPEFYCHVGAVGSGVYATGQYNYFVVLDTNRGVRPSISLKNGIDYVSGSGTASNPYVIE